MARRSASTSSSAPTRQSTSRSASTSRRLVGRTRHRTSSPRWRSARARCEPMKPVAPVTKTFIASPEHVPRGQAHQLARLLAHVHHDRGLEAGVHRAVAAERVLARLPVVPVGLAPELEEVLRVLLADEVAGPLPAARRERHRAPGRALVIALAG